MSRTASIALLCFTATALTYGQEPGSVDSNQLRVELEHGRFRVVRVNLAPRQETDLRIDAGGVLVYFTGDLRGRMPPAEVEWLPAGTRLPRNAAPTRFEALLVEFKPAVVPVMLSTPPELAPAMYRIHYREYFPSRRVTSVWRLFDSPVATVSKHRLNPQVRSELPHFHRTDTLIVYLASGEVSGTTGQRRRVAVSRGDVHVLPANTFHEFVNMGNDPIELIAIFPK